MPTSDGARLRARGHPITLMDDTEATLIYDFDSLETLEEEFGSIGALVTLVEVDDAGVPVGKAFRPLRIFIGAGLLHAGYSIDDAKRILDPSRLTEYFGAAQAALGDALPRAGKAEEAQNGRGPNGSTGASSTTSEPSSSAELTPTSGG